MAGEKVSKGLCSRTGWTLEPAVAPLSPPHTRETSQELLRPPHFSASPWQRLGCIIVSCLGSALTSSRSLYFHPFPYKLFSVQQLEWSLDKYIKSPQTSAQTLWWFCFTQSETQSPHYSRGSQPGGSGLRHCSDLTSYPLFGKHSTAGPPPSCLLTTSGTFLPQGLYTNYPSCRKCSCPRRPPRYLLKTKSLLQSRLSMRFPPPPATLVNTATYLISSNSNFLYPDYLFKEISPLPILYIYCISCCC